MNRDIANNFRKSTLRTANMTYGQKKKLEHNARLYSIMTNNVITGKDGLYHGLYGDTYPTKKALATAYGIHASNMEYRLQNGASRTAALGCSEGYDCIPNSSYIHDVSPVWYSETNSTGFSIAHNEYLVNHGFDFNVGKYTYFGAKKYFGSEKEMMKAARIPMSWARFMWKKGFSVNGIIQGSLRPIKGLEIMLLVKSVPSKQKPEECTVHGVTGLYHTLKDLVKANGIQKTFSETSDAYKIYELMYTYQIRCDKAVELYAMQLSLKPAKTPKAKTNRFCDAKYGYVQYPDGSEGWIDPKVGPDGSQEICRSIDQLCLRYHTSPADLDMYMDITGANYEDALRHFLMRFLDMADAGEQKRATVLSA